MDVSIVQETCCNCGVLFWIGQGHHNDLVQCKNSFYCPNGHPQHYAGKTEAEKQKERAEKAEHRAKRLSGELKEQIAENKAVVRSNRSLRGVITRKKNQKD